MKPGSEVSFKQDLISSFAHTIDSPDAFVAIDYDFRYLFVNPTAEKFYLKGSEELIGLRVPDVFPQQWNFGPFKAVQKNVTLRKSFEMTYHSPFSNRWVMLSGQPFEHHYTFFYKIIDQKTALNNELRDEVRKRRQVD